MGITYTKHIDVTDHTGEAYKLSGLITTLRAGNDYIKGLHGFQGDLSLALELFDIWRGLGIKGAPSGPHSFFKALCPIYKPPVHINGFIDKHFHGAWIERLKDATHYSGEIFYYDMKSAYLWAGITQAFPRRYMPYEKGDTHYCGLMNIDPDSIQDHTPHYFKRNPALVTYQDVKYYGFKGKILWAIAWRPKHTFMFHDIFSRLDAILPPEAFKMLSQAYWGMWACRTPVERVKYTSGEPVRRKHKGKMVKSIEMKPNLTNLVYATLLINAVIRRCHQYSYDAILISTDAILTQQEIPEGDRIGDWRLKDYGSNGAEVKAPTVWTLANDSGDIPEDLGQWSRHSGISKKSIIELAGLPGTDIETIRNSATGKRLTMERANNDEDII